MEFKYSPDMTLMYPLMLRGSYGATIDPFIPIFAYKSPVSDGEPAKLLELYEHTWEGDTIKLTANPQQSTITNHYRCEGIVSFIDNQTTLRVPGHVFMEHDTVYLVYEDENVKVQVTHSDNDLITVNKKVTEEGFEVTLDEPEGDSDVEPVFVGVVAPVEVGQYRAAEGIITVPTILLGTTKIIVPKEQVEMFHTGDKMCIRIENNRVVFVKHSGLEIGVVSQVDSDALPPIALICLKNSMCRVE